MENKLIITIVNRGFAEDVMTAAKQSGANGGTIVYGRGTGSALAKSILGILIEPEKELVLIVASKSATINIMTVIYETVGLGTPGSGVCFALPIDNLIGATPLQACNISHNIAEQSEQSADMTAEQEQAEQSDAQSK